MSEQEHPAIRALDECPTWGAEDVGNYLEDHLRPAFEALIADNEALRARLAEIREKLAALADEPVTTQLDRLIGSRRNL